MKTLVRGILFAVLFIFLMAIVFPLALRWLGVPWPPPVRLLIPLLCLAIGMLLPLAWFAYLGARLFAPRNVSAEGAPPSHKTLRRIAVAAISLVLGAVGIFSGLLFQHGCVCITQRIACGRMVRTCFEIRRIESACATLLDASGKQDFHDLFAAPGSGTAEPDSSEIAWNEVLPELLRKGRDAEAPLTPEVRQRLASSDIESTVDAWGRPYEFSVSKPSGASPQDAPVVVRSLGRDGIRSVDDILRDSYPETDQDQFEFYDARAVNQTPFARLYCLVAGRKWLTSKEAFVSE